MKKYYSFGRELMSKSNGRTFARVQQKSLIEEKVLSLVNIL